MFAHTNSLTSIYSKKVRDSGRKLFNRMRQTLLVITVSNEPTIKTKYVWWFDQKEEILAYQWKV